MPKIPVGLVAVLLVGAIAAAGCGSSTTERTRSVARTTERTSAAGIPATPAGRQLRWFVERLNSRKAPPTTEISAHFTPAFLKAVPPAKLVSSLEPIATEGPFRYGQSQPGSTSDRLAARFDGASGMSILISIAVTPEAPHRISGLLIQPAASPELASWRAIDAALAKLADRPSLLAAEVHGERLQTVHALDPDRAGAIGSAFKLYVLAALGNAIEAGKASWREELAIRSEWKSIPSGEMQNEPAGARFPVRRFAGQMIAISDNTATDHLIRRLGREAVEKAFVQLGNHSARRNVPLLTTREMTVLKIDTSAGLMRTFAHADTAARRRLLSRIDSIPLSIEDADWSEPRAIDTIEWFASPANLGRAMVGLIRLARSSQLAPIRPILSKNSGVSVDPKVWRYAGFKGGSEPGVLALAWYLERRDGRAFVLAIVLNDRTQDIGAASAVNAAIAAIELLARS